MGEAKRKQVLGQSTSRQSFEVRYIPTKELEPNDCRFKKLNDPNINALGATYVAVDIKCGEKWAKIVVQPLMGKSGRRRIAAIFLESSHKRWFLNQIKTSRLQSLLIELLFGENSPIQIVMIKNQDNELVDPWTAQSAIYR